MTYARVNFVLPGMHTALIDPVKWNSDWESITTQVQHVSPAQFVESAAVQLAAEPDGMDGLMIQYQGLLGNLCGLQLWITKDAARYFVREDLEKRWMDAGPALRGKHVLIGLSNACSIARNLHDTRMYCGRDLKFSRLQGDGRIVLDWLRAIMVSTRHEEALKLLETPRYIPDAAWDAYADKQRRSAPTDNEKLALGNILVLRTKLICHFLHFTIRSFIGEELPEHTVEKIRKKKIPSLRADPDRAAMEQLLGPEAAKAVAKENTAAWKARQQTRKEHCSYVGCLKVNNGAEKFPRCKKCFEERQREVLYCSQQCQKADWKVNHKAICGKPLNFDAVSKLKLTGLGPMPADRTTTPAAAEPADRTNTPAPPSMLVIGPPTGGYKRSPLLVNLIRNLNKVPKLDYIISDSLAESVLMDFPDPEAQSLFRKCREKAMATGDRQSVAIMAHFLCWMFLDDKFVIEKGATANVIVGQLKKEYSFDELHLAVNEMQQRQNRDPFKRPVLLSGMSPQNWVKFCRGMNVNKQVVLS